MTSSKLHRRQALLWAAWLAALAAVVLGSLLPPGSGAARWFGRLDVHDKAAHFCAYAALAAFAPVAGRRMHAALLLAACLIATGVAVEFGQLFTGRLFEVRDMAANACGVLFGLAAARPRRLS